MPKKRTGLIEKSNDSKDLLPNMNESLVDQIITGVLAEKNGDRKDKFYLAWMFGLPIVSCTKLSGYSLSNGYKLLEKYKKNQNVRARLDKITGLMPERYRAVCRLRLVEIAELEGHALQEYRANPKLLIEKPGLAKQIKQSSGVLGDDFAPPQIVNIGAIQNAMFEIHSSRRLKAFSEPDRTIDIASESDTEGDE